MLKIRKILILIANLVIVTPLILSLLGAGLTTDPYGLLYIATPIFLVLFNFYYAITYLLFKKIKWNSIFLEILFALLVAFPFAALALLKYLH